jgi:hypothetical protein
MNKIKENYLKILVHNRYKNYNYRVPKFLSCERDFRFFRHFLKRFVQKVFMDTVK